MEKIAFISTENFNHKKAWSHNLNVSLASDTNDFNSMFINEFAKTNVRLVNNKSNKLCRIKYEDRLFERDLISLSPNEMSSSNETNNEV